MKLNKKGFMLAEVVVVSVVVALVLVTLFAALNRLSSAFETRNRYYDVDAAYLAVEVNNILIRNGEINTLINSDDFVKLDTINDDISEYKEFIIDELMINDFSTFFSSYNLDKINEIGNLDIKQTFKDYIEYLKGNLNFDDEYIYVIISEMCQTRDDCYYYTLKVRWYFEKIK